MLSSLVIDYMSSIIDCTRMIFNKCLEFEDFMLEKSIMMLSYLDLK